jgi:DNA-binding transcriptional MerR regulator
MHRTAEGYGVGDLARATGLTVRTLHHWDAIGLVVPSERSAAGHRRYTDADVRRIYQVVALRGLGLGLAQVRQMLGGDGDVRAAVREHLAELDRRIAAEQALRDRVAALLDAFDAAREPSTAQFIQTIEEMTMHEQYYTPDQLRQLEQRRQSLGPDGMERAQQAWAELLAEARAEMERGTDPADERVQALAARWQALVEQFTGGDPGIAASLKRMYDEQGPQAASRGMVDPELMAYIGRARAAG